MQRRDRGGPGRAGRPLRARRGRDLQGGGLPRGGQSVRDSPVSVAQLPREGRATEMPQRREDARGEDRALLETGDDPGGGQAAREVPRRAGALHASPGPGRRRRRARSTRSSASRRWRSCARPPSRSACARCRARAEGRAEHRSRRSSSATRTAPASALLLSAVLTIGEQIVEHAAGAPRRRPGRDRRQRAPDDRHLQGPRHHRDRGRRGARSPRRFARAGAARRGAARAARRARGASPTTASRIDFRVVEPDQFGNVLQHLTGSKQHNVELREYAVRRGMHVSEYGVEEDETRRTMHRCADRAGGLQVLGLRLHRAGAARGPRRAGGRARRRAAELVTEARPAGRPALPHDAVGRAQHTRGHGPGGARPAGYEYLAMTDHSASYGFGNDVQAGRAAAAGRARSAR